MRKISFYFDKRKNVFTQNNVEWYLSARIDKHEWVLCCWDEEPDDDCVEFMTKTILRSMEFYHQTLVVPKFDLQVEED